MKDIMRADLVPVIARCVASLLQRGLRPERPLEMKNGPESCLAFIAIAQIWVDLLQCFESAAGEVSSK